MAINIYSLSPLNPTAPEGGTVTFSVTADDSNGETLTYEWQFSNNGGVSYTSAGLIGNTSDTYTTSQLTPVQNGLYWRVVITNQSGDIVNSDEVPEIGDRILAVTTAPSIVTLIEYDTSFTTATAVNLDLTVEASLLNADITTPASMNGMSFQWQRSTDDGSTWSNINDGDVDGTTSYTIVQSTELLVENPVSYGVIGTLTIVGTSFGINNYQYRLRITDSSAANSPVNVPAATVIINPVITIYSHPGEGAGDTQSTNCYKTSIANSGKATFTVGALTTAGSGLGYSWEFSFLNDDGTTYSDFQNIQFGINEFYFSLVTGTSLNSSTLQLTKMMYFEEFRIRCVVTGSSTEPAVTSNSHSILMTDVITYPEDMSDVDANEDYYGDIENRSFYKNFAIENATFSTTLDCSRNTGLNGNVTMIMQRQNPGETTWNDIGIQLTKTQSTNTWTSTPDLNDLAIDLELDYTTPPLRINVDNGAKYRVKVTSTAVYTLDGSGNKILTEIYSQNETLLNVFRQIFITGQPTSATVFNTFPASFAVTATPSSSSLLTYQWQYNTANVSTGWTNITSGNAGYSGYNTNLLTISSFVSGTTPNFYRVVINTAGALASVTSGVAQVFTQSDLFSFIDNINDYFVLEFTNVEWNVNAQSLSLGAITYQWQKSTDYVSTNPSAATWSDIAGATSNTLELLSITSSDDGYYRCKLTSQGGVVAYTNVAVLDITIVAITITKNNPTAYTVLESATQALTFEVNAIATVGTAPTYQWQYSEDNGTTWNNFGTGYQGQSSAQKTFIPNAFSRSQNGIQVRCKIDAASVPNTSYSNVATITVNRRFTYFADSSIKNVAVGNIFELNLNPSITGGTVSYQWESNNGGGWVSIAGQTASVLSINNVQAASDGIKYRCQVTLPNCNQHRYSRNNIDNIVAATDTTPTVDVELNIAETDLTGRGGARSYSNEASKNGAAIGTIICVGKPPNYVNNQAAVVDDITQWSVSVSGHETDVNNSSSTVNNGAVFDANKPSWVVNADYKSPKWTLSNDRFKGYIELRGQWLKKSEFPALYRVIGDAYGVTQNEFRLPNPYGKKLMGTGNVNNNSGSVSIVPLYDANGLAGGDKNVPGSIGGRYNYTESQQLPPGSPGINALPDGTAGNPDPATFSLGNYSTSGFENVEGVADTTFSGSYTYRVGPLLPWVFNGVPEHAHIAVSAGYEEGFPARSNSCSAGTGSIGPINPSFYAVEAEGGTIFDGPEGINDADRGREHVHAVSLTNIEPTNNAADTHSTGIGPANGGTTQLDQTIDLQFNPNSNNPSFNLFLEPAGIKMTTASKPLFDASLKFTLRNNDGLPLLSPYFRLKYMIKAY